MTARARSGVGASGSAPAGTPGRADLPPPGSRVHFIGIGGAGMRGLALLFDRAGYRISGSDRGGVEDLTELAERALTLHSDHAASHPADADLVIRSSAVPADHVEVRAAVARGIPVLRRARAMGALLNGRPLLGVTGTHGKTTITAMTGYACEAAGLDPLVLVGGRVEAWGGFARPGSGPAVVEADEFDRSFLELEPTLAVVSSLEPEHLDTYGDFAAVEAAYGEFVARAARREGYLFCADDGGASRLADAVPGGRSYGFAAGSWLRIERAGGTARGEWRFACPAGEGAARLRVPGRHNALNAGAAFACALLLGAEPEDALRGLADFPGAGRRLEVLGSWRGVTVVDDYAHHPTEVAASLEALRAAYPGHRVEIVFQPHLFTRTRDFAAEFGRVLDAADAAYVLPIYPSRETPIEGVSAALVTEASERAAAIDREAAGRRARDAAAEVDPTAPIVIAYMGAGDVTEIAHRAARELADDAVGA